jgi:hypothetical protein
MNRPVSCDCGNVRGILRHTERCTRIRCYCHDCQAFAAFLKKNHRILDEQGGTDVVIAHPRQLELSQGRDALKCMSLSDKGMLRWYAGCCNSAIGNISRNRKVAFVGLVHTFLARSESELNAAFGPARMLSCTDGARSKVASSGWRAVPTMLGFARKLLWARLSGSYRDTPFFGSNGKPMVQPLVLTPAQRAALERERA